jgi:diphosphomevalonate decarboxylase
LKDYYENPGLLKPGDNIEGEVVWRSPSNIALVKYWGKYGVQLPKNASLSFALSESYTETSLYYKLTETKPKRDFLFEEKPNESFANRVWKYLDELQDIYPFLAQFDIKIQTKNSFPHSAGIASSASALSALALCLVDMEQQLFASIPNHDEFLHKASYLARLGSGSAARSVYAGFSIWGAHKVVSEESDNRFAVGFNQGIHPIFQDLNDAILIVDDGQKEVSSSVGHSIMNNHPYSDDRLLQAHQNLTVLGNALKNGDTQSFIKVVENEALSLHGLMMSSDPWFILMHPNTLNIIKEIKNFRVQNDIFICFTLDAGANVHLIYGKDHELEIRNFIDTKLKPLCHQGKVIFDRMGKGPQKIK